jgi:DNA mismatch repair protein MSH5
MWSMEKLQLAHMEVLKAPCENSSEDKVTYLFKLRRGFNSDSFGGHCAMLNGVPNLVVDRANIISSLLGRDEDIRVLCAKLSSEEELKLQVAETVARKFLEADLHQSASESNFSLPDSRGTLQKILSRWTYPN